MGAWVLTAPLRRVSDLPHPESISVYERTLKYEPGHARTIVDDIDI